MFLLLSYASHLSVVLIYGPSSQIENFISTNLFHPMPLTVYVVDNYFQACVPNLFYYL